MENDTPTTQANQRNQSTEVAYITGDVSTASGDFVGRDKIIHGDEVRGDKVLGDKIIITEEQAYTIFGYANPYLGLRPFTYDDREIYAGREMLAQEAVRKLTTPGAQQTLLFITGASGSGKSSFAQAALIPLLENHYAAYQKTVHYAIFRPSRQPLVMLCDALQKLHPELTPETLATNTPKGQINLLLIDQFEELFIQSEVAQHTPFCAFLTSLPSFDQGHTHVLITLRIDYLEELFAIQPLWAIAKEGVELRAMHAEALRSTIQKPLQTHYPQKRFAPELLDRLVQDVGDDATLLPLLQVTLVELWKTGKLILTHYRSLTDAIRKRAEMVYAYSDHAAAIPQEVRPQDDCDEIMCILLDLINVSPNNTDYRDARHRRTRYELEQGAPQRPALIEELINARLLVAASETRNGATVEVIDIIHESLISNWERLRNAITEQRQQLQQRARFKLWLDLWVQNGCDDQHLLLTDMQLAEARALAQRQDIELQNVEARKFYQRSFDHQEAARQQELQRVKALAEAQRQRAQTFRNAVVVAGLLFLLAVLAASWSFYLNKQLNTVNSDLNTKNAQLGETNTKLNDANNHLQTSLIETKRLANVAFSRQLAAQSTSELNKSNYEIALLLAIESGQITETIESYFAIRDALAHPWRSSVVLYGHMGSVTQATWNRDESKILTSSADHTARIWDAVTGKELVKLTGHTDYIYEATWSHDESKILTRSADYTARIWDAHTGQQLVILTGHTSFITQAKWNHDDSKILTRSDDDSVRIWDAHTGQQLVILTGHTNTIAQVRWSQDESKILTSSVDHTARIWDAHTGQQLVIFIGHTDNVFQATWNRDESKVLTGSADHTARIWDAHTGQQLVILTGHTDSVNQVTWSQDESKVLTGSADHTARIWDAHTGQQLVILTGHEAPVWQATWGKNDSKILTRSDDHTARIWDAHTGQQLVILTGHTGNVTQATWSQDESKVLTRSDDHTARIWDAHTGQQLVILTGHTDSVTQARWSGDESKILTRSDDGTVRIWDARPGQQPVMLTEHAGSVTQATWSQDESKILTSSADHTARIWDAHTGQQLVMLTGHTDYVFQARWSQDESKILTSSRDGTARIWDAHTGQQLVTFTGHTAFVTQATWSQDDSKILTRSDDHTARIWDAHTGQQLVILIGHAGNVTQARWSQDDSKILTSSDDHTARIWDAHTGQQLVTFTGHTDSVTQATWNRDESKILTSSRDGTARIWDAHTGQQLVTFTGHTAFVTQATWSQDDSKILTRSDDHTARIWDAHTGQQLVILIGHAGNVTQARWSQDDSKILTSSDDHTARIWDAHTGQQLVTFTGHTDSVTQATWNRDESKILTGSADGTARILYTRMTDLLAVACKLTPRNLTWDEWHIYLDGKDNKSKYTPTCPSASIPPDAIVAVQDESRTLIQAGQVLSGTQRLGQLNSWLQENGQFKNYGVDVPTFVAKVVGPKVAKGKIPAK